MRLKILIKSERGSEVYESEIDYCTVGRKRCELTLSDSRCSQQHALLYESFDGSLRIKDLHSTNGTYLNGERVTDSSLRVGDEIRIGRCHLIFLDFVSVTHTKSVKLPLAPKSNKRKKLDQTQSSPLVKERDAVVSWPENLYAMPPKAQKDFIHYVNEKGERSTVSIKEILSRR